MNINEVIKYPILSEKTYQQMENGVYTFAVDVRTNKVEVKKVVEYIFDVKVRKVNIFTINKKPKNVGRFKGFTNRFKKAIVTLKDGDKINIFPEESKEKSKVEKPIEKEITEVEKKAAAKIAAQKSKSEIVNIKKSKIKKEESSIEKINSKEIKIEKGKNKT